MKTQFDFHFTDKSEILPVEFQIYVEWNLSPEHKHLIQATITELYSEKISNCCSSVPMSNGDFDSSDIGICSECFEHCDYEQETEYKFEFWFSDVKDIPDKYTINVGEDDEEECEHDHYTTGFEWCEDEIADYIFDNRKSWEKV